jgi:hypothetical protein
MGVLFEGAKQIEPWLMERGLNKDDIRSGLVLLIGDDWERISANEFVARLNEKGFEITRKRTDFFDELEALVRGANKLKSFRKHLIMDVM